MANTAMPLPFNLSRLRTALGLDRASDDLVREQFRLLSQQIPQMYGAIILNCVFLSIATADSIGAWLAFAFPIIAIPVMIGRIIVWRRRTQSYLADFNVAKMRRALQGNVIAANVLAAILGLWAAAIMARLPDGLLAFVPLFTILSMVVCAYCLSGYPLAAYSVVTAGSVYMVIALAITSDTMLEAMAANIVLVSCVIVYMVARQFAQLRRLVESRSELDTQRDYANALAHEDHLTGLPNRRALLNALRRQRNECGSKPVALVMIDLNGFKPVNDTFGHAAGDSLLTTLGRRLEKVIGEDGLLARLGGDEFCALLYAPAGPEWLQLRAEKMAMVIANPVEIAGHQLHVSAAIGIAAEASMPDNPLELMQHADIALYEAKLKGGSAICTFKREMEAKVKRRTLIEQALSDPEQMGRIALHFQPIFDLRSGAQLGFEALARWDHPDIGRIPPTEFIEVAERSGLTTRLTIHLFRKAVAVARDWDDRLYLSFNLSGSGLGTSGLDRIIPQVLDELGFSANRLCVEVTETALLGDTDTARALLANLQALGVRIVLDDFGAGYASIGYLRQLHFDGIKLDGSLIRDISHHDKSRQLLLGVLHLCQAIGATVTAEMVESEDQLDILRALPIDNVQGFLFGKPMTGGEVANWLADGSTNALPGLASARKRPPMRVSG